MMKITKEWLERDSESLYVELCIEFHKRVMDPEQMKDVITTYLYSAYKRGKEVGWVEDREE